MSERREATLAADENANHRASRKTRAEGLALSSQAPCALANASRPALPIEKTTRFDS